MPKAFFDIIDGKPLKNNTGGFLGEKIRDLVNLKHKGGGNRKNNITLDYVFEYYQKEEELVERCKLEINNKTEKVKCYKSIKLENPKGHTLPNDLIFSLKRFDSEGRGSKQKTSKIKTYVDIKDDIEVYNTKYHISAVIIHTGSNYNTGHYYTYVKSNQKDTWIQLNDDKIKLVNYSYIKENINTNGYIFLYKNENYKFKIKDRNGIANIGNSCYFNSILQLLISTDEYLNPDKMQKKRKSLYEFLTMCTVKSKSSDINNGEYLRTFNLPKGRDISYQIVGTEEIFTTKPKKKYYTVFKDGDEIVYIGVSAFGRGNDRLSAGCEEDAKAALDYILGSNLFEYGDNFNIYKVIDKNIAENKINKKNLDVLYFTLIPPFYNYICNEKLRYENKDIKNDNYMIQSLTLEIPPPPTTKTTTTKNKKKVIKKFEKINFDEAKNVGEISKEIFDHINEHLENIGSVEPENPILKELSKNQTKLKDYTEKLIESTKTIFEKIENFKNITNDYNKIIDEKEKIIAEKIKKISNLANYVFSS